MWNRLPAALALTVVLTACRETQPANSMFVGLGDVHVADARLVESPGLTYVVTRLTFTNDTPNDMTPEIGRFILLDRFGNSYSGVDSGSAALLGISNSREPVHAGQTRDYVVGFRVAGATLSGNIAYEP